jgi:hypothetical protein
VSEGVMESRSGMEYNVQWQHITMHQSHLVNALFQQGVETRRKISLKFCEYSPDFLG